MPPPPAAPQSDSGGELLGGAVVADSEDAAVGRGRRQRAEHAGARLVHHLLRSLVHVQRGRVTRLGHLHVHSVATRRRGERLRDRADHAADQRHGPALHLVREAYGALAAEQRIERVLLEQRLRYGAQRGDGRQRAGCADGSGGLQAIRGRVEAQLVHHLLRRAALRVGHGHRAERGPAVRRKGQARPGTSGRLQKEADGVGVADTVRRIPRLGGSQGWLGGGTDGVAAQQDGQLLHICDGGGVHLYVYCAAPLQRLAGVG